MKLKTIVYLVAGISFFLFISSLFIWKYYKTPIKTEHFYASVNVTDSIGFDLNKTALTFGNVIVNGSSNRDLSLRNDMKSPVVVEIDVEGEIKDLLRYKKFLIVKENETKNIPFVIDSRGKDKGFYDGYVNVKIKHL